MGNNCNKLFAANFNRYYTNIRVNKAIKYLEKLGDGTVDLELNNTTGIAKIFLNQPKKKNAISGKMIVEFYKSILLLEEWHDGKAVTLQGVGDCFCSGGDFDTTKQMQSDGKIMENLFLMTVALKKLANLPLISVAYVSGGGAFGGGAEIAMSADFCLIHPDSKIGFVHAKMGITPAWGGGYRLVDRIGYKKALICLLNAKPTSALDAVQNGLVDGIVNNFNEVELFMSDKLYHDKVIIQSIKKSLISTDDNGRSKIFVELAVGENNRKAVDAKIKHS